MGITEYSFERGGEIITGRPFQHQGVLDLSGGSEELDLRAYTMTFPFLPPSKNQYDTMQWQFQHSIKSKWKRAILKECRAQMIPRAHRIGLAALLVFPTRARRDIQNYAGPLWNFVPDGLQEAGVIDGDHAGKIDFGPQLGIKFAYDDRRAPADKLKRTKVIVTMDVRDIVRDR